MKMQIGEKGNVESGRINKYTSTFVKDTLMEAKWLKSKMGGLRVEVFFMTTTLEYDTTGNMVSNRYINR